MAAVYLLWECQVCVGGEVTTFVIVRGMFCLFV